MEEFGLKIFGKFGWVKFSNVWKIIMYVQNKNALVNSEFTPKDKRSVACKNKMVEQHTGRIKMRKIY